MLLNPPGPEILRAGLFALSLRNWEARQKSFVFQVYIVSVHVFGSCFLGFVYICPCDPRGKRLFDFFFFLNLFEQQCGDLGLFHFYFGW